MTHEELPVTGIATFLKAPMVAAADDRAGGCRRARHPLGRGHHVALRRAHRAARPA